MGKDSGYGSSDDEFYDGVYDDDDDDGYDEPDSESESSGSIGEASSCKVIRKESLLDAQKDDLQRVMDLLSLKEHHARTLLIHYRWDVDKVFAVLVDKGLEHLYNEAGVVVGSNFLVLSRGSSKILCEICYEDVSANEMTAMECGHCFCDECWTEHFIVKINEGQSRRITCMADKCCSICDEGKIRNLVSVRNPRLAEKFDNFLLESYIEDNERVKWCPSIPHCGNAVRIENDKYCEVECVCGLQFCFNCSSNTHSPCSCLMWELWLGKQKKESDLINWIMENVKFCPKCHKPVEKNGGCNLVQCICGQPFCWLCGAATGFEHTWSRIANHECGRYKDQEIEEARKELWRYSHYHNRYQAHMESLKAEENMKEKLQQSVAILESNDLEAKDYSWMSSGHFRLIRSRQILLYSYPFAFFMFGDELFKSEMSSQERTIKQNLFEDQQQQLETNIERLSLLLEAPLYEFDEENVWETKMKIINLSAVADNLCKKLYDCIDNDLLGPLEQATHIIAPYRSMGVEKASEL